jgi:CHAT domain-containing protein
MRSRLWKICIGCILLTGLGFAARVFRGYWLLHSAETESNRLYANFRPFLYRWVSVPYGNAKGSDPANCTPIPETEILQLRLQTVEAEDILGVSGRSLRLRGRASLLTCQLEDSISQYQRAILASPADAGFHLELGIAFALNANPTNPLEYEGALEHILKAGQTRRSPESLYDSALLFQQVQLFLQASQRWADTVAAEPVAQWKEDSNHRLTAMQDFLSVHERQITALSSPVSYLAADERQQQKGEELALDMATREWLAEIEQLPDAARAVQHLGALLLRDNHDNWLLDLLKIKLSPQATSALAQLTEAVRLNLKGEHGHSADAARSAEKIFEQSHNSAGALRARLEIVYSFDRQGNADACLAELGVKQGKKPGDPEAEAKPGRMETEANKRKYTWIEAQARLEHITCLTRKRRQDVISLRNAAYEEVSSTGYSGLALRALSFLTEPYVAAGSRLALWRREQQGLKTFWSLPLPVIRVYSLYYTLANSARNAGDIQAAVAILREGTLLLEGSGLNLIRGIVLSSLGQWEMEASLPQQADRAWADMENEFKQVNAPQVWDEAEVAHAEALVATGRARDGLTLLRQRTQGMGWPYSNLNSNLRRVLLPAFGNAYLRSGALQDACQSFLQSITEAQDKMATVQSHAQRDDALREIESSWRGLTAVKLGLHSPLEALAVWETFRSERNQKKRTAIFPNCGPAASPPSFALPESQIALVYAFLPTKGLSAWMIGKGKVEQKQLDGTGVKERVERLSVLVSDPDSSLEEISSLSAELYQRLLAPFADSLPPSGTLIFDPDGELAGVPWNVLEGKLGHPLVERFAISQVIGLLNLGMAPEESQVGLERSLIFGPPALSEDMADKYPFPHRAAEEAETVHRLLPNSLLFLKEEANFQTLKAYASRSTLFHFAGHSISNGGFSALLLPQTRESPPERQYATAEQIAELDLRQMKTVVLASCSSGTGEQYGAVNLDSLTRAFLEAGAKRVIAASWDVSSARTEELMTDFSERLEGGQLPAEALRQAQLQAREKTPHPYYWAAFEVFGGHEVQ